VLFAEHGAGSAAQIKAFEDSWRWDESAAAAYEEVVEAGGRVADVMRAFMTFLGHSDMMAYLCMMAPRLVELRRVMKPTASLYLHCDPTASHYLKLLLDAIFGPQFFRNEIIWERTTGRKGGRQFGRVHDVLLYYSRSKDSTWNPVAIPQTEDSVRGHDLVRDDEGRLCRLSDLSGAGQGPPRLFLGCKIEPPAGRHWMFDQAGIDTLSKAGRIAFSKGGSPRLKTLLEELPGVAVRDI
jgi:site-specific DNA-methyltransferase (adenine-specific)